MDTKNYDWLLGDVTAWQQRIKLAQDDDDSSKLIAALGIYGKFKWTGWVATNDAAIDAVLFGSLYLASAKCFVNFALVLKFCAKRVRLPNSPQGTCFSYGDPVISHLILDVPGCAISHETSQFTPTNRRPRVRRLGTGWDDYDFC